MTSEECEAFTGHAYSVQEWDEIESAIVVLGATLSSEDKFFIMLGQAETFGDAELSGAFADGLIEIDRSIADVQRLHDLYRDHCLFMPMLPQLGRFFRHLNAHRRSLEKVAAIGPGAKRAPNERLFAQKVMTAAATIWERRGGTVNQGKEYRRFFEAVVRPVLSSPLVAKHHSCAWSEGMFVTHARAAMKIRGATGTRGRKRQ